jgi:hypothetical protein
MHSDDRTSSKISAHDAITVSEVRLDAISPIPYRLCSFDLIDLESEMKVMRLLRQAVIESK